MRTWVVKRRERTRHLIELGGLVVKSGLAEALDDDRAALLGALIGNATLLRQQEGEEILILWRRAGKRAFAAMIEE